MRGQGARGTLIAVLAAIGMSAAWTAAGHGTAARATAPVAGEEPPPAFFRVCSKCHDGGRIVESRRMREQWEETLEKMVAKGATGSDEDFDAILFYLISEFGRVNVNSATAEDIAVVLHLEPKDADAIVRFRNEHGRFGDFEALKKVPGIPVDSLAMLRDAILF